MGKKIIYCIICMMVVFCGCAGEEKQIKATTTEPSTTSATSSTASTTTSTIKQSMPGGVLDPNIYVGVYNPEMAWEGTTLFADLHNPEKPGIIEVNMEGEIIWEYEVPNNLKQYTNPGFDAERLPNDNILFVLPRKGVYEINREGGVVWSYLDEKVSHDADRLPNGNTLVVWGGNDGVGDAQVKEINPEGEVVWSWHARDYFLKAPYRDIREEGWTHTNAVTRLENGNTLISLRNFNFIVEVDPQGSVVRTIGEGVFDHQHDPEVLPNKNILVANHGRPHEAVEINPETGEIVWRFPVPKRSNWPVRDADRLPNGNTLITGTTMIIEVTPKGEVVWQLKLINIAFGVEETKTQGFYKAERINPQEFK